MSAFSAQVGASSAVMPTYTGTASGAVPGPPPEAVSERVQRITTWLDSDAARPFDGRWVLLTDACDVADVDDSAVDLRRRHPGLSDPLIVFVQPPRIRYGFVAAARGH